MVKQIGVITKGSLVEGLEMKLDPEQNVEDMKAGKFVVIEGDKNDFFSMVTDMRLDANNQEFSCIRRAKKTRSCAKCSLAPARTTSSRCGPC